VRCTVQGRIDVTRTFDGRELNTEYLFGLFANVAGDPNPFSLLRVPISYEIFILLLMNISPRLLLDSCSTLPASVLLYNTSFQASLDRKLSTLLKVKAQLS